MVKPIRRYQGILPSSDNSLLHPGSPMVASGEQGVTRGGAHPGGGMGIGKAHALRSQAVDVGGGNFSALRIVALDVPVTQVIGVNDEDVGVGSR